MKSNIPYIGILALVLIFIVIPATGIITKSDLLFKECQPSEIIYDNFGPYCLYIEQNYKIYPQPVTIKIMREENFPNGPYTMFNYPWHGEFDSNKLAIMWNESGLTLSENDSINFIIEKSSFIGGR